MHETLVLVPRCAPRACRQRPRISQAAVPASKNAPNFIVLFPHCMKVRESMPCRPVAHLQLQPALIESVEITNHFRSHRRYLR